MTRKGKGSSYHGDRPKLTPLEGALGACAEHTCQNHHTQEVTPYSYQRKAAPTTGPARLSKAGSCDQRKFSGKAMLLVAPDVGPVHGSG